MARDAGESAHPLVRSRGPETIRLGGGEGDGGFYRFASTRGDSLAGYASRGRAPRRACVVAVPGWFAGGPSGREEVPTDVVVWVSYR